jgi:hypothetical protein
MVWAVRANLLQALLRGVWVSGVKKRGRLDRDIDAHLAGRPGENAAGGVEIRGVKVRHLELGDFLKLLARDLGDLLLVRLRGAGSDVRDLLQEIGGRGLLGDEGEALVSKLDRE